MKYCGIELKSNEARIIAISSDGEQYSFIAQNTKKIKLADPKSQEAVNLFRAEFETFFDTYKFDKIAIKERGRKGRFAGGADSFKMEGIIQTLNFPIDIVHANTIKSKIKGKQLKIDGLSKYQEEAMKIAVSLI